MVFNLVKNLIIKKYLLVEFGNDGDHAWTADAQFASVSNGLRIVMQEPAFYEFKRDETLTAIEILLSEYFEMASGGQAVRDVFISYCWKNSLDAMKSKAQKSAIGWLDPRSLVDFFKENKIDAWIDTRELMPSQMIYTELCRAINQAKVVVACVSDEYVASENCQLEFRFAHSSLKMPIIKAIVGTGKEWRKSEISFLSGNFRETDFQNQNQGLNFNKLNISYIQSLVVLI
jgi:hypothetical protein